MNCVLVINKDKDMTSFDVIRKIRRQLNIKKIGHAGTLDPLATGVLIVLLGEATKLSNYLMASKKVYEFDIIFGFSTDTEDITGNIISDVNKTNLDEQQIDNILNNMKGISKQIPPMYSAIKKDGKKLYELARKGIEVEREEREITVYNIERITELTLKDGFQTTKIRCEVSKGTYVRTLATYIGKNLGTNATLSSLNRISSGNVTLNESYTLSDIENGNYKIIDMVTATKDYYQYQVNEYLKNKVLHGMKISFKDIDTNEDLIFFVDKDELLGIYKKDEVCYKAERVWN